jgi:hypothetical protein
MNEASRDEHVSAGLFAVLALFQVGLAAGAPWGRAAYGGGAPGRLPLRLRVVSAAAACLWSAVALVVGGAIGHCALRRRVVSALLPTMVVATVMNGASRSPVERALWTPMAAAQCVLLWRMRGADRGSVNDASRSRRSGRGSVRR